SVLPAVPHRLCRTAFAGVGAVLLAQAVREARGESAEEGAREKRERLSQANKGVHTLSHGALPRSRSRPTMEGSSRMPPFRFVCNPRGPEGQAKTRCG